MLTLKKNSIIGDQCTQFSITCGNLNISNVSSKLKNTHYVNFYYIFYFSKLAVEAEKNMEGVNPPLFLKFVNLLINDAIFLLDEALSNMAKLKEMQQAQ